MRMFLVALPLMLMACAQGFQGSDDDSADDDDQTPHVDAPVSQQIDARIVDAPAQQQIDAPGLPIDAPVSLPDGGGLPGTCTDNSQCTVAGECCFIALCVPGTPLPPPLNCAPD